MYLRQANKVLAAYRMHNAIGNGGTSTTLGIDIIDNGSYVSKLTYKQDLVACV